MLSDKMRASMGSSGCQEGLDSRKYLLNKKEETRDSKITNTRHRLHCNWHFLPINSSANSMMIWDLRILWRKQGLPRWLTGKESACQGRRHRRCRFKTQGQEDPLEEQMATHSGILAWEIPWTEEPGGLQSMGSERLRHNWAPTHTGKDRGFF